jgi:hypothetical protein
LPLFEEATQTKQRPDAFIKALSKNLAYIFPFCEKQPIDVCSNLRATETMSIKFCAGKQNKCDEGEIINLVAGCWLGGVRRRNSRRARW